MTTFHEQSVKKSRKRRQCTWCAEIIEIGQPHESYRYAEGGDVWLVVLHPECMAAMQEMAKIEKYGFEWSPGDFKRGGRFMNDRTCGNCRWWLDENDGAGQCRQDTPTVDVIGPKYPTWPVTDDSHWCGKWRDKAITPEQEQQAELVTRFALAIVSDCDATTGDRWEPDAVWRFAAEYVDARPTSGGE